jgi:hypothetical protein
MSAHAEPTPHVRATDLADRLVSDLESRRIESVAFVVTSDTEWTLPLYELAITTARRGWARGIQDARYWFITPEPEPVSDAVSQRLEPEGITFIGSTYPDVRPGLVLLDPQGESIEPDVIVGVGGTIERQSEVTATRALAPAA